MRRPLGVAGVAVGLVVLVGCSGPGAGLSSSGGGAGSGAALAPGGAAAAPESDADRQVVTTATASVEVKDPAAGAQRVSELVEAAGGRVDQRTEQAAWGENGNRGRSPTCRAGVSRRAHRPVGRPGEGRRRRERLSVPLRRD